MIYERLVRPWLFRVGGGDAETAHDATLRRLARLSQHPYALAALRRLMLVRAPLDVFGVRFPNPVGLAAGMDKDAAAAPAWAALGFGFVEVGTVTWYAQPGNDRPRLVRLPRSHAVINHMGFNNAGAAALHRRLTALRSRGDGGLRVPLGISLGKSARTPVESAVLDYAASLQLLYPYGDYFAVNVSSPNTAGLRSLQEREQLATLLRELQALARELAGPGQPAKPLLVKIAPDLGFAELSDVVATCLEHGVAGLIAANTTRARTGLDPADEPLAGHAGGLSGRPLRQRAREVVTFVHRQTAGALPIIGVGGIMEPDDAVALLDAGASLVQLYTGLVYRGPALVPGTVRAIRRRQTAVAAAQAAQAHAVQAHGAATARAALDQPAGVASAAGAPTSAAGVPESAGGEPADGVLTGSGKVT